MIVSSEKRSGMAFAPESDISYTRAESSNVLWVKTLNGHFSISVFIVALCGSLQVCSFE